MCRRVAWIGRSILVDELLFKTHHGIVDQGRHSRMGAQPTNRDGFGVGWYGTGEGPQERPFVPRFEAFAAGAPRDQAPALEA